MSNYVEPVELGASVREAARVLRAQWRLVLLGACVAALAAGVLVAAQSPLYEARATLTVDVGSTPAGTTTAQRQIAEAVSLLRSDAVRRAAADALGLPAVTATVAVTQVAQTAQVQVVVQAGDPDSARHVADAVAAAGDLVGGRRAAATFTDDLERIVAETAALVEEITALDAGLAAAPNDESLAAQHRNAGARLDVLEQRYAAVQVDAALVTSGVAVDGPAVGATEPVAPTPLPTIGSAALAGAAIGFGVSLFRRRRSEHSLAAWEATVGLPVWADLTAEDVEPEMPSARVRGLRVAAQLARSHGPVRSVAILAADGAVGAISTAAVVAALGRVSSATTAATLMIDADMRHGALAARVGLDADVVGLADVIGGEAAAAAVHPVGERCWVVPAGRGLSATVDTGEVETHPRLPVLLRGWAQRAELTLIAGPEAGIDGSGLAVATAADRVILLASRDADLADVQEAVRRLRAVGAPLEGLVLARR